MRKKTVLCAFMVFLMAGMAACGKKEKAVTPEELVGGIRLSDSDAMTVSVTADISGSFPAAGTGTTMPISGDFAASISAEAESTGKACHISGSAELDMENGTAAPGKVSAPFEEYISKKEGGYDFYVKASRSDEKDSGTNNEPEARWNHLEKKGEKLFEIKADAGKIKKLKLEEKGNQKTRDQQYAVTGIFPLAEAGKLMPDMDVAGQPASAMLSGLKIDMEKMNLNLAMSFDEDKRLKSLKVGLAEDAKAEIARVLEGCSIKSASMTLDFDFDSKVKVQVPSGVQEQASASAALGGGNLLSENGLSARTSEEFAGLFHLDYRKLEDENKLLISNMLYYMGDNERIRTACRGWDSLSESDRNALAAIAKAGYIETGVMAEFGADGSGIEKLVREAQFPNLN